MEGVLLAADLRRGVPEVETLAHLAQGLLDRIVDLLQVDAADGIEEPHREAVNRQGDGSRQPRQAG